MPKRFFSIPFGNNADLVALQDYLKTKIAADGVLWQEPATFHMTLAFVDDAGDNDLDAINIPASLPAFGVGGDYLSTFSTPEGYALVLTIGQPAQLVYLQAALFYELRALGLAVSPYSWPGMWRAHVTLAHLPSDIYDYAIPQMIHLTVDRFDLTGENFEVLATFPLLTQAPGGGPVQEMVHIQDIMIVHELRGSYPNVPTAPDVDIQELTKGDDDPTFVTLPIGKVSVTSRNQRHYGEDFVQELGRQPLARKPVGLMGHLKEEDRATAFPAEAVHWVGVKRVGELLWGKAYVVPGDSRDRLRRYKAHNKAIATSIDAVLEGYWDKELQAYRMIGNTLDLHQIDLAPVDRAGIPDLGVVPHLTKEMDGHPQRVKEQSHMDINEIRNLKPEDAQHLPQDVREVVQAQAPANQLVAEMRQALGLDEKADLVLAVRKMADGEQKQREEAVKARVKELVEDPEKGVKLEAMRGIVIEMIELRKPQTVEDAERIYGEVIASDRIKAALQETVVRTMGPAQGRPASGQPGAPKYFKIPDDEQAAK